MSILVVDDVAIVRYRLSQALSDLGHTTKSAADGTEALEILRRDSSIDIVVTDDCMPHVDGIQLFHQAQQIERLDDSGNRMVPAFILMATPASNSAADPKKKPQYAIDLGFSAVLLKPVKFEDLVHQVNLLNPKKKGAAASPRPAKRVDAVEPATEAAPPSFRQELVPVPNLLKIAEELRRAAAQLEAVG